MKKYEKPQLTSEKIMEQTSLACYINNEFVLPVTVAIECAGVKASNAFANHPAAPCDVVVFSDGFCEVDEIDALLS